MLVEGIILSPAMRGLFDAYLISIAYAFNHPDVVRLLKKLGVHPKSISNRSTYHVPSAIDPGNMIAIHDTAGQWVKILNCSGYIVFSDASISQYGRFTARVAIDGTIIKPGKGTIVVKLIATFYDIDKQIIETDDIYVQGVFHDGGIYTIDTPTTANSAKYVSISSGTW